MKKIQLAEEAGRAMAQKRYGSLAPKPKSDYGHSKMGHNVRGKFEMARGGKVKEK